MRTLTHHAVFIMACSLLVVGSARGVAAESRFDTKEQVVGSPDGEDAKPEEASSSEASASEAFASEASASEASASEAAASEAPVVDAVEETPTSSGPTTEPALAADDPPEAPGAETSEPSFSPSMWSEPPTPGPTHDGPTASLAVEDARAQNARAAAARERRAGDDGRREIRLVAGTQAVRATSDSYQVVSADPMIALGTYGVSVDVVRGVSVAARGFGGTASSTVFGGTSTRLSVLGGELGATYSYVGLPYFRPYISAFAGPRFATLDVGSLDEALTDNAVAFAATGLVGAELAVRTDVFVVGLFHDHGYQFVSDLSFDDARYNEGEERVDLGSLATSGYTFRFGIFVGFRL